uniref:zinc ribbon domain-containing protein n=1 Tax=Eubacterium cellulosolvens TaxID=29322 RepID=UPI0004826593|nr:zinc ribbon domain-containing protein [[Eubacterium] cellulosolvens]
MAMIQCPNCGDTISDKAKTCVHCGYELQPAEKRHCSECGQELEDNATVCPKCGCPVEKEIDEASKPQTAPQQVEVTGVKMNKNTKKIVAIVAAVVVVAIAAIFGVQHVQKQNAAKEAARISQEYGENLELVTHTMLSGATDAETCGNLIKKVWYNAIYEERDIETDKYTRSNGYSFDDFNTALANLFTNKKFKSEISGIEDNQTTVQGLMKDMKNPPDEYKDAYDALSKLYDAYTKLTNLAINPTGSLQTFSNNFNDADTEVSNCYSAMKLYIEN